MALALKATMILVPEAPVEAVPEAPVEALSCPEEVEAAAVPEAVAKTASVEPEAAGWFFSWEFSCRFFS